MNSNERYRNEIRVYTVQAGITMSEAVNILADEYGWNGSVLNLSGKRKCTSFHYGEAVEQVDMLNYALVWVKRKEGR